jgi:hypothetical protein
MRSAPVVVALLLAVISVNAMGSIDRDDMEEVAETELLDQMVCRSVVASVSVCSNTKRL